MASSDESLSVAAWKSRVERVLRTRWSARIDWTDEVFLEHYLCELDDSTEILELVALLPVGPVLRDRLAQLLEPKARPVPSDAELVEHATVLATRVSLALGLPPPRGPITLERTYSRDTTPLGWSDEFCGIEQALRADPHVGPFVPLLQNALYTLLGSDYANAYFVLSPWCAACEALRETPAADLGEAFSPWSSIAWTGYRLFSRDDDWFLIAQDTIDQHYRR